MSIETVWGDDPAITGAAAAGTADGRAERLPQVIARIFARYADRPAFATRDGGPRAPYATVTYGEVWRRVTALAAAWRSELEPGDFVAILGFTSADFVTVDLATTLLGAPNVPLQAGAPAARIAAILDELKDIPPVQLGEDFSAGATSLLDDLLG